MTTMSQADYARRHGVSRKTVTKWKESELIVLTEEGVDVEESDERLRKYRDRHDGRAQRGAAKIVTQGVTQQERPQGNGRKGNGATGCLVELPISEICRRLRELDWKQPAPSSAARGRERARLAAQCLGLQAAESDLDDDGHWGGFQLRDPKWWGKSGTYADQQVVAGFGFELSPLQVLKICRDAVMPLDEDDHDRLYAVDPALLPLLAHPHWEGERQRRHG